MNEWTLIRTMKFEDCTVSLYRNNYALKKWKGETTYNANFKETTSLVIENEKEAWTRYYTECRSALDREEARK